MKKQEHCQTYYTIYSLHREKLRCTNWDVARALGKTGRGRSKTTASKYVNQLYDNEVSFRPNLILRTYENSNLKAFFLKAKKSGELTTVYNYLKEDPNIAYFMLLSGKYDFFVTTRCDNYRFKTKATVAKKTQMFTPIFTIPKGWRLDASSLLKDKIAHSKPSRGKIERIVEDFLPWDQREFDIHNLMMNNAQMSFSTVAKKLDMSHTTVKKYFYKNILPYCNVTHYFFPEGYSFYDKSFILLESDYETGLIDLFTLLPCTTYIYPFEEEIALTIFHKGIQELMFALKKLEEREYLTTHSLFTPLQWE